jgi:hypothetical protein
MHRMLSLTAALTLAFAASSAFAADAPAKAKAAKPAPAAKAAPAEEPLTPAQLEIAPRVFTGRADCEFSQKVEVAAIDGKPGHFKVAFGKATYTMTPQETTTGAVRLEDRKAGIVWLQIPAKSMLMDTKAGHRLVDACQTPQQRNAGIDSGVIVAAR